MPMNRFFIAGLLAAAVALSALVVAGQHHAEAVAYNVTKTADTADGACNGDCSLREAIMAANTTVGAVINVPRGVYTLTLTGAAEADTNPNEAAWDLDIRKSVTINGAGAGATIVDGNQGSRVFQTSGLSYFAGISNLTVQWGVAAAFTNGGGISNGNSISLTLNNVIVQNNAAGSGGGIANAGTLTLNNSTVRDNVANASGGGGGGILNAPTTGTLTVSNSTISGNVAGSGGNGGGISNRQNMTVTNSTISGNGAAASGGGLYNNVLSGSFTASLTNVTLAGNSGGTGSGIRSDDTLNVKNTIVANNSGGTDCYGTVNTQGHNLDTGSSCGFFGGGDWSNANANLSGLGDYGGLTQTMALNGGSQAIDTGSGCPSGDQRGYPRVGACDIGAFEFGSSPVTPAPTPAPTRTPTPTPSPTPTPVPTPTPTLGPTPQPGNQTFGDADCAGGVNSVDALKTLRHIAGQYVSQTGQCWHLGSVLNVDGTYRVWGNVDCDNYFNSVDALKILRHAAGLAVTQTPPCPGVGTAVSVSQ